MINVMRMLNCEIVMEVMNSFIFLSTALTCAIQSSCCCYIVHSDLHERPVFTFFI